MAFCPNCGANVEGRFCAKCGTAVAAAGAAPGGAAPNYSSGTDPGPQQQYAAPPPAQAGGLTENVAGTLAYVLGIITGIIFLVLAPYNQSKFVRFHAFQAIFFHAAFIAVIIVEMIISMILPWSLSILVSLMGLVIWLGALAIWVLLLVKAYQGQKWKLPVIGDLAEKQA